MSNTRIRTLAGIMDDLNRCDTLAIDMPWHPDRDGDAAGARWRLLPAGTLVAQFLHQTTDASRGNRLLDDRDAVLLRAPSRQPVEVEMSNVALHLADDNSHVDMLKISVDQEGNDGRLRVLSKSVKGFGVPMKRLMKIFHLEMNR